MSAPERLLTISQVCDRIPYSRVHIYRLMRRGEFPGRIRVGPNRVGWREADVERWIIEKINRPL